MRLSLFFLICLSALFRLSAEESAWHFDVGYALGYADYSEDGNIYNVRSDWNAWNSELNFKALHEQGQVHPYYRVRLMNSEKGVESWTGNGRSFQVNDLHLYGGDVSVGMAIAPKKLSAWRFTPQAGLIARYQNYVRENFVTLEGATLLYGSGQKVKEFSQSYGAGGGFCLSRKLSEKWTVEIDTELYGLFYSKAENDGFDSTIEGESGMFWDSSLSISKQLQNPNHGVRFKINGHLQWIEGGQTRGGDGGELIIEWPENRLFNLMLELAWKSRF
ncbi:hypothetical protein P0Y35_01200 [Kiritimatiellaeota bacterium B1221]|nr:hypothetical protein [Kiritimatiellaeota bacterium B1221]